MEQNVSYHVDLQAMERNRHGTDEEYLTALVKPLLTTVLYLLNFIWLYIFYIKIIVIIYLILNI